MYRIVADFGNYDVVEESGIDLINITKQSCDIPYDVEYTPDTPEDHRKKEEDHESDWKDTLEFAFLLIFFMIFLRKKKQWNISEKIANNMTIENGV